MSDGKSSFCNWCGRSLTAGNIPCNAVEDLPTLGAAVNDVLRQIASVDRSGYCSKEIPNRKPELFNFE